jgi:hypothetical protein
MEEQQRMRDNKKLVEAIGAMRPALDNKSPPTFAHLSSKKKGIRMAAGTLPDIYFQGIH